MRGTLHLSSYPVYLFQEDIVSRFLLEDGSGCLLCEETLPYTPITRAESALISIIGQAVSIGLGITPTTAISTLYMRAVSYNPWSGLEISDIISGLEDLIDRGVVDANGNNGSLRLVKPPKFPNDL